MTALDDALNESVVIIHPADLKASWEGAPPSQLASVDPESIHNLGSRMSGAYIVEHSLDDGLPDPVTMTNTNDASGKFSGELLGRNSLEADVWGWRNGVTSNNAAAVTSIPFNFPTGAAEGDLLIVAITASNANAVIRDPDGYWSLLTVETDAPLKTWVFTTRNWIGGVSDTFVSDAATAYSVVCTGAWATTANGTLVGLEAGTPVTKAETTSLNLHTAPAVTLSRTGWILGVWSAPTAATGWTAGAGTTEIIESTASSLTMVSLSDRRDPGVYTITATTGLATAISVIMAIPVYLADRLSMDARSYFSPFNKKSPLYGFDRDTAETELTFNVLTDTGVVGTTRHKGQMADITIKGRTAEITAISKTRLDLDHAIQLPTVHGPREGCSVDWLVTYLMARGGQYVGPGPAPGTIYWAPMYGSAHAHMGSEFAYSYGVYYDSTSTPPGPFGLKPPTVVPGPFITGMFACQTNTRTEQVSLDAQRMDLSREVFPNVAKQYPNGLFYDQMSLASSSGRITFWLRGDPAAAAPAYLPNAANTYLFKHRLYLQDSADTFLAWVIVEVRSSDRHLNVSMGSDVGGGVSGSVLFSASLPVPLETDGSWHFYGVAWDYANGLVKVKKDGMEGSSNSWATSGWTTTAGLSTTDRAAVEKGHYFTNLVSSHVPISDVQIEAGPQAYSNSWTRHYPIPAEMNATMRPTYQSIAAIVESSPVQGWETLSKLAQSTMSHYRTNELDNFEFLPLSYFGEPDQLEPTVVMDTEVNAGELDVETDPSRTRNVVTVVYQDTQVDSKLSTVLYMRSAMEIPKGKSSFTFPLDTPAVEIHGQSDPDEDKWIVHQLTSGQVADPTTIPADYHYMTVNSNPEGTGWGPPLVNVLMSARITNVTATTVTILFTNKNVGSGKLYLASNLDGVGFLRILGYAVRTNEAYVTERDGGSIGSRRERALEVEMPWIQDRRTATVIAQWMVTALARPRSQVTVEVMGDPRRTPGMMVELADSEGTQAEGTWRILAIKDNVDGPQFTQTLSLVAVMPVAVWDGLPGWDEAIWGE